MHGVLIYPPKKSVDADEHDDIVCAILAGTGPAGSNTTTTLAAGIAAIAALVLFVFYFVSHRRKSGNWGKWRAFRNW
jgi:hypothetical protein